MVAAQISADGSDRDYLIRSWETSDGLPDSSVTAMVQTADGYLWFGTFGGLVRFDGVKFTVFDPSNTPQLASPGIVNLHLDTAGRLWASTVRGLVVSEPHLSTAFHREPNWTGDYVRTFAEQGGIICVTSFNGKVFRTEKGRFEELPEPPGKKGAGYFGYVDRQGSVWVAQDHFFGHWDGKRWVTSAIAGSVTDLFKAASPARDGSLLVLNGAGLLRIDHGQVLSRTEPTGKEDIVDVWRMDEDRRGTVRISTSHGGLFEVSPTGAVRRYNSTNGLPYNSIRFSFEDREGNLWVGSSGGGLSRIKPRTFVNYGVERGLPEPVVKAIVEEAPGRFLLGTYGEGIARLEDGHISRVPDAEGKKIAPYVQCILVDQQGSKWLGTFQNDLQLLTPSDRLIALPRHSGSLEINALFQDSQGRIWVGGDRTVSVFAEGQFKSFSPGPGVSLADTRYFAEDKSQAALWAATTAGLFRFVAGSWTEIKNARGMSVTGITCLRAEADGTLWIGKADSGLLRLRDGIWKAITEEHGLPARRIASLLDDDLGFFWLGSNRGVIRVARKDLEQVADGTLGKLPCQVFNSSDGLASIECAVGYQSTALKDSQGRLWFATLKGVTSVDPRQLHLNTNTPPVIIERVISRDRLGVFRELPWAGEPTIMAPAGTRELGIEYTALSYTAPEKMQFAYKLEGLDEQWVNAAGRRSVYFHTRSPGTIRFRIKAANNDGVWNETGATLALTVQPFAWQTVWFRLLALTGLAGGVGMAAWRLTRSKLHRRIERLEQRRMLEAERARLASVLEATSDFVAFGDCEGRALFINAAGRRMIGLGGQEDLGERFIGDFYPAWASDRVLQEGLPVARRAGIWSGETALLHRDGHEIPVSQVIVAHKEADGQLAFLSTIARDIAERKRVEEALRQSQERLRTIIRAEPECVKIVSRDGVLLDMNPAGLAMLEAASLEEVQARPLSEFIAPEYRVAFAGLHQRVFHGGSGTLEFEVTGLKGARRRLETNAVPLRDAGGAVTALLGVTRDITEQKRSEESLRENQRVLATLLSNLPGMVYRGRNDADRTMEFVSEGCRDLVGYTPGDLTDNRKGQLGKLIHPEERPLVWDMIQGALQARKPFELNYRIHTATGAEKWVWERGQGIFSPTGELMALEGFITDITPKHQAEIERREALLREQRAQEDYTRQLILSQETERRRIAAELHDSLGQNLLLIKNRAQLALADQTASADLRLQLEVISQLVLQTVGEIRQISRDLHPRQLDHLGLTRALEEMIEGAAQSSGVAIERKLDSVDDVFSAEAAANLYRVVQESLNNILKHSGTNWARIELERDLREVLVRVRDNGCGFDAGEASRAGGIGLRNMTERVQMLGGKLTVDSQPHQGTRIEVTIPIAE